MYTHEPRREFGFQFQDNSRFCLCPRHAVRKPTIVQRQRLSKEASFGCNGTPLQISARGVFLFQSCHEIKSCAWSTNRPCLTPSCRLCQLIGHAIVSKAGRFLGRKMRRDIANKTNNATYKCCHAHPLLRTN